MSTPARTRSGARPLKRYDLFGWDYPLHCPLSRQEVAWHVRWARRTGGPLLALACGTGRVLINERRFDPSLYRGGRRSFGWSQTFRHPKTGQRFCRRGEIRLSKDRRRVRTRFIYKTVDPSGFERIEVCLWSGPVLTNRQYLQLFRRAGFAVETHCGYREGPDDGKDPVLCFICRGTEGVD